MPGDSGSSLKERPAAFAGGGEEGWIISVMRNYSLYGAEWMPGARTSCPHAGWKPAFQLNHGLNFSKGKAKPLCEWQTKRFAIGIQETIHWTHNDAARLVKVAYAFIAFVGVDNINIITFGYRPHWALRLTKAAIDAIIGNR